MSEAAPSDLNCPYCPKQYKRRGWIAEHIAKNHENLVLLEQNMTYMQHAAIDQSHQEAMLNLSENPFFESDEVTHTERQTSTPAGTVEILEVANNETLVDITNQLRKPAETTVNPVDTHTSQRPPQVPLCDKATSFVRTNQASLPLTLTQVLPTLDWTSQLDKSIQEKATEEPSEVTALLERVNNELRYFICENCGHSFRGKNDLDKHMYEEHNRDHPTPTPSPPIPDSDLPSLGDYLTNKRATQDKQSEMILNLQNMVQVLTDLVLQRESSPRSAPMSSITNPIKPSLLDVPLPTNEIIEIEESTEVTNIPKTAPDWGLLVGDSHVKYVNSRTVEKKLKGKRLRNPALTKPKEASAYTTTRYWPEAKFPDSNLEDRVPKLLSEREYKYMITLAPSNNIKKYRKH